MLRANIVAYLVLIYESLWTHQWLHQCCIIAAVGWNQLNGLMHAGRCSSAHLMASAFKIRRDGCESHGVKV